jgi:hypothetical protein
VRTIIVIFFILSCFESFSQLCGASFYISDLNVSNTIKYTSSTDTKRIYYKFFAKKGCNYIFSTCGLSTIDTELRIIKDTSLIQLQYNDDGCKSGSLQSYLNFYCNQTGGYILLVTRYNNGTCKTLNNNVIISYISDCGIVMNLISGEESSIVKEVSKIIPALSDSEIIVKLYELDGREIPLDSKGIVIAEYADRTRKIIKIK